MRYRQAPCSCLLRRAEARAVLTRRARPIARHVSHVREVGRSVAALRRADGDEEDVRALYDLGQPLGASKLEPSCALGDELLEAGLVERDPSLSEACHALLVVVQACHPVFYIGKRRPGRQPDVARPNDTHIKVLHATCFPLHAFGSKPTVHNRDITGRGNTRLASTAGSYSLGLVRLATAFVPGMRSTFFVTTSSSLLR